jgi:hypothetical protein
MGQLTDKPDIKHLCEVSKYLYSIAAPILYESVTIKVENEENLGDIDVEPLLRTRCKPINLLHHVKDIEIASQFHTRTKSRCVHNNFSFGDAWPDADENDEEYDSSSFPLLAENLMPLLEGCRDGSLRGFT